MRITLILAQRLHYYVLLRSCTHNLTVSAIHHSLNIYNDDVHGHACFNKLRVCTFAILRKSLLLVLRHFQHQYLCENIFTVTGVSRSFAYTAGFQNTLPYDSLMALCNFCLSDKSYQAAVGCRFGKFPETSLDRLVL